jgi:phospholipid-binding lipoprotein MlaA
MRARRAVASLTLAASLAGCAHLPADDPADPLEPVNRGIYVFNETADRYVLRPVAKGYDKVMPSFARTGVRNFFSNLFYPTVIVNDLLQLKVQQSAQDFCRFVLNSTFGLAGFVDVATPGGLVANNEDFGQTLGYWGLGEGWYLMLPFLGPSNNRDLVGRIADSGTSPLFYLDDVEAAWGLGVLDTIDNRADLLPGDRFLEQQLDRYVFVRTIYLQDRQNKVYDGNPPREDYGFEEDFEDEEPPPVAPAPEE